VPLQQWNNATQPNASSFANIVLFYQVLMVLAGMVLNRGRITMWHCIRQIFVESFLKGVDHVSASKGT
jgi:hypothetical protein